jgi:ATP-dependent Zn protease
MTIDPTFFFQKAIEFLRYGAIIGFLVATTLLINLNNKAYNSVFKEKKKQYFWFFLVISLIPLLIFIAIFNFIFQRLTMASGL